MTIEARKLNVMKPLADLDDGVLLSQIENLLNEEIDLWDELIDKEKAFMKKGLKDLDEGCKISYQDFKKSLSVPR